QISEARVDILTFKDLLGEITAYKKRKVLLLFASMAFSQYPIMQSHSSILDLMDILRCIEIVPLTWTSFDRCLKRKSHAPARTCLAHKIDNFFSEIYYVIAIRDS
ncbi:33086_t:CDS:2, partial [Racocetra persica]